MSASFYFYDLETSGISSRSARIMQFAGQRVDMNLEPIGEPDNIMIRLPDDILPEPDAILITGITPQMTHVDGITEHEFLKYFYKEVAIADTIFVGYNNVRFDDEFMRFLNYRNFYDAYEWSWQDGRSRWDLLDVVRTTRALRPDGIQWPFAPDGRPTNRLELLTKLNGLKHEHAHDALSDVIATISVARLIRDKQPRLFEYLLSMRSKQKVKELVESGEPFVYVSGRYPNSYQKATVTACLGEYPGKQGVLVYDLRRDPADFDGLSAQDLADAWYVKHDDETMRFPVKLLQYNRCPAVAPLSVITNDEAAKENIKIDLEEINQNIIKLIQRSDLYQRLLQARKILDGPIQESIVSNVTNVDERLYDGFISSAADKTGMSAVRAAGKADIAELNVKFSDERLAELLPLYKARNFKQSLNPDQVGKWDEYRAKVLFDGGESSRLNKFYKRLEEISKRDNLSTNDKFLLEELRIYAESIMP